MTEHAKLDNDIAFERRSEGAWLLRATQRIPLPRAQLFPFFADARNLAVITPPRMAFRIHTPEPIVMRELRRIFRYRHAAIERAIADGSLAATSSPR